jgi:hypothetical protein
VEEFFLEVSKKTDKLIKLKKPEKNNRKKNRINRLKNHKKVLVRFGFDFQSLKPIKSNRTGSTMPALKKKACINRKNPRSKVTFSSRRPPPFSLPLIIFSQRPPPPPFFSFFLSFSLYLSFLPLAPPFFSLYLSSL